MKILTRYAYGIIFVVISVGTCTSISKDNRRSSNLIRSEHNRTQSENHKSGNPILRRNHRQAEDSYEEGVEYEYEEETETESPPTSPPEPEAETETEPEPEQEESNPTEESRPEPEREQEREHSAEREREGEDEYYDAYEENGNEEEGRHESTTEQSVNEPEEEVEERREGQEPTEESETYETTPIPELDPGSPEGNRDEVEEKVEESNTNPPQRSIEVEEETGREGSVEYEEESENEENPERRPDFHEERRRTESHEENQTEKVIIPEQVIVESGRNDLERYTTETKEPMEKTMENEDDQEKQLEENGDISEEKSSTENSIEGEGEFRIHEETEAMRNEEPTKQPGEHEKPIPEVTKGIEPPRIVSEPEVIVTEFPKRTDDSERIRISEFEDKIQSVTDGLSQEEEKVDEEEDQLNPDEYAVEDPLLTEKSESKGPPTPPSYLRPNERDNEISQSTTEKTKVVETEEEHIPKEILGSEDEDEEEERYEGRRFNDKNRVEDGEIFSSRESNEMTENRKDENELIDRIKIIEIPTTSLPLSPSITHILDEDEDESSQEISTYQPSVTDLPTIDSSENRIVDVEEKTSSSGEDDLIENKSKSNRTFGSESTFHQQLPASEEKEDEPGGATAKIECFPGYQLSVDGLECLDIDECAQNICGSTQICTNLPGTYRCSCSPGFVKDFRNERMCRDLNECEIGNGGCSHDCINTQGSYYCACADDFDLLPDRRRCILRPTTTIATTTTTTTTATTTTTTAKPTITTTTTTPIPIFVAPTTQWGQKQTFPLGIDNIQGTIVPYPVSTVSNTVYDNEDTPNRNCPTPPVPRGSGIAYLYCSRSPVGIHHRHSQLERRLIQDWTARRNKSNNNNSVRNNNLNQRFRHRRNLKRRLRQTTYSPGSMCELRCRSGFELKGQYTLHCNVPSGTWQGTTNGFCQVIPKVDSQNLAISLTNSETIPSNEIPRLASNTIPELNPESIDFIDRVPFRPTYAPYDPPGSSFRPNFYQPPVLSVTKPSRFPNYVVTETPDPYDYWKKPKLQIPAHTHSTATTFVITAPTTRKPYYNYDQVAFVPITTTTTTQAPTTTSRNSFIQLTYRFKTPWIKCPDDMAIDIPQNQSLAYVIVPQPQTNVDWWRQVTSEPSWAKGLENEVGPGKYRISFRARTSAPQNNTAECSFILNVRDSDPPRVRECPESFTLKLSPGQSSRHVNWVEPHFSDNIRITSLKKSHESGTILSVGEHLVNYEAKDGSGNQARCSFTITVYAAPSISYNHQNNFYRKPYGTEGITEATTTTSTSPRPVDTYPQNTRNVVCHVGKKGRRIVFQSKVVPRGCTEMTTDLVGDLGHDSINTLNTVTQNSAENSATSQISSVSFSSNDHPQSSSAFSQAVSNGRNANRQVHSASSVTNNEHGTNSRASSYAISLSSSSRNFDLPFIADKQVYDDDFVVPTFGPKARSGQWVGNGDNFADTNRNIDNGPPGRSGPAWRDGGAGRSRNLKKFDEQQEKGKESRKYFRHFDSWDMNQLRDRPYAH